VNVSGIDKDKLLFQSKNLKETYRNWLTIMTRRFPVRSSVEYVGRLCQLVVFARPICVPAYKAAMLTLSSKVCWMASRSIAFSLSGYFACWPTEHKRPI